MRAWLSCVQIEILLIKKERMRDLLGGQELRIRLPMQEMQVHDPEFRTRFIPRPHESPCAIARKRPTYTMVTLQKNKQEENGLCSWQAVIFASNIVAI